MPSIEARLRSLEERSPKGYEAYDADGQITIKSGLPALDWYTNVVSLLMSRGRTAEKASLRSALARTSGPDNAGGVLYELAAAMAAGAVEYGPPVSPLKQRKVPE